MTALTVDVSLAIKWYFNEDHAEAALRTLDEDFTLHAPDLIYAEFGNVIWKKLRASIITESDARDVIAAFSAVPLVVHSAGDLLQEALTIAVQHDRTVYDSLYVATAVHADAPLVTADERLVTALAGTAYAPFVRWLATN